MLNALMNIVSGECEAVKLKGSNIINISKYVNVHSHSLDILNRDQHRQAKSLVVGELIKSRFKEEVGYRRHETRLWHKYEL